jgi:two-component SAPR family response regulator
MPSMNGIELLNNVMEINSNVSRLLISAFEIHDKLFEDSQCIDKFLQKPITIADLMEVVQKYINCPRIKKSKPE